MVQALIEDRRQHEALVAEERRQREAEVTEERRQREARMAEELRQQELERKERETEMREQIKMLQRLITERPATKEARIPEKELTRLTDQDDIEANLLTFERTMQAYGVDKARWTLQLAPQLTGKAQQAYAALGADDSDQYDKAILRRYNINEETYRRSAKMKKGETPRELVTRLIDLARKWSCQLASRGCRSGNARLRPAKRLENWRKISCRPVHRRARGDPGPTKSCSRERPRLTRALKWECRRRHAQELITEIPSPLRPISRGAAVSATGRPQP